MPMLRGFFVRLAYASTLLKGRARRGRAVSRPCWALRRSTVALGSGLIWAASTLVSSSVTLAQTPSPLQEWQYASGVLLQNLF
jgi:hypothetical protein